MNANMKEELKKMGWFELFEIDPPIKPDNIDNGIALERLHRYNRDQSPRVGDYVIMPTGEYQRFSYKWDDIIQTCHSGSFYLGNGYSSMSGSLEPGIKLDELVLTQEKREGCFWFFHHDWSCAHNGIGIKTKLRVYKVVT
jgi:hypothetical protein